MNTIKPQGPFCQSCAMPMAKPQNFGTNADGIQNQEYCHLFFSQWQIYRTGYHYGADD